MNKLIKFCIVIAVILLVAKMVSGFTGSIDLQGMQKKLENTLDKNALYDIDASNMFQEEYEVREGGMDKTVIADSGIKKLDIELGGCFLQLEESEDSFYHMAYSGQGKTQVYAEDGELFIKVLNGKEWKVNADKEGVILSVPQDTLPKEVEIDLGAGQMQLDALAASVIEINLGAGQIRADQMQAEKANLTVGAGEIVLENVQFTDMKAQVGAGSCRVQGSIKGNVEADCAMGNIVLSPEGQKSDFNYEIMCVTGNITIEEEKYSGLTKEQTIENHAGKNMELDCAMGNIRIAFEE